MSTAEAPWDENSFYFSLFIFYLDRQLLIGYQREAWTVTVWWERALTFTSLGNVRRPIYMYSYRRRLMTNLRVAKTCDSLYLHQTADIFFKLL